MLDAHINEEDPNQPATQDPDKIEYIFIFSLIWSFGAPLKHDSRKRFEDLLKKISARVFPPSSLFDNYCDYEAKNFYNWEKMV